MHLQSTQLMKTFNKYQFNQLYFCVKPLRMHLLTFDPRAGARLVTSVLTVDVFVPPPHEQRPQQQQQQTDAHAAHDEGGVVLLLSQRHLAQVSDGVGLTPLEQVELDVNTGPLFFLIREVRGQTEFS